MRQFICIYREYVYMCLPVRESDLSATIGNMRDDCLATEVSRSRPVYAIKWNSNKTYGNLRSQLICNPLRKRSQEKSCGTNPNQNRSRKCGVTLKPTEFFLINLNFYYKGFKAIIMNHYLLVIIQDIFY